MYLPGWSSLGSGGASPTCPPASRHSLWSVPLDTPSPLYGWRFQGTDEDGDSFVFDVFKGEDGWHVHHTYA